MWRDLASEVLEEFAGAAAYVDPFQSLGFHGTQTFWKRAAAFSPEEEEAARQAMRAATDRRRPLIREARNERRRAQYRADHPPAPVRSPEEIRRARNERKRARYWREHEERLAKRRMYDEANREHLNARAAERARRRHAEDPALHERNKAYMRSWYRANRESVLAERKAQYWKRKART